MKNKILFTSLISGVILVLSACGGGGSSERVVRDFDGKWQGVCLNSTSNSFKQVVTIDGVNVSSEIELYSGQLNCEGVTPTPVNAVVRFAYQGEVNVSSGCDTGKAEKVDASIVSVTANGSTVRDNATIRTILDNLGVSVVPEFNLLCIGSGKLLSGDVSGTNNGSTDALRPTEMDPEGFTKI